MLSKEICKKCCNISATNMAVEWNKQDEENWRKHFVCCPFSPKNLQSSIFCSPPVWCPYALEHVVQE